MAVICGKIRLIQVAILIRPKSSRFIARDSNLQRLGGGGLAVQSRSRESAQDDKWNFCLTVGTLCAANQERP
jgi:hypothetical protein